MFKAEMCFFSFSNSTTRQTNGNQKWDFVEYGVSKIASCT